MQYPISLIRMQGLNRTAILQRDYSFAMRCDDAQLAICRRFGQGCRISATDKLPNVPTNAITFEPTTPPAVTSRFAPARKQALATAAVICPSYGLPMPRTSNDCNTARHHRDVLLTTLLPSAQRICGPGRTPSLRLRQNDLLYACKHAHWLWPARGGYGCRDLVPWLRDFSPTLHAAYLV